MAETLNFREAVQRAGVSRQRLNEAIRSSRLPAARGGGPGKPTTIQLKDLQAWCVSEGLAMPVEASERLERLDELFAGMQHLEQLMAQVLDRLERSERTERSTPALTLPTAKVALLDQLRAMQAEGLSLQAIANKLNAEGVPTRSERGRWQKGALGNLLAQGNEIP